MVWEVVGDTSTGVVVSCPYRVYSLNGKGPILMWTLVTPIRSVWCGSESTAIQELTKSFSAGKVVYWSAVEEEG